MTRFTLEQRWEILKTYFQSGCCVAETVRYLKRSFGRDKAPTAPAVRKFVQKVRETGMLVDNTYGPRRHTVRTDENVAAVAESLRLNSRASTRHLSQQLKISRTSLRRILHNDLGLLEHKKTPRMTTERPKRPLSAYMLWLNENREQLKKDNPVSKANELWRAMKDKTEWEAKAIAMKEKYTAELKEYEANDGTATAKDKGSQASQKARREISEEESCEDISD